MSETTNINMMKSKPNFKISNHSNKSFSLASLQVLVLIYANFQETQMLAIQ